MKNTARPAYAAGQNRKFLMFAVFLTGVLCLVLVVATAYAANIKYQINQTEKQNAALQGEIENLKVAVNAATNIQTIEQRAHAELGMVYPAPDQYIFVAEKQRVPGELAMLIKAEAHQ